jgi:hypothetical protein
MVSVVICGDQIGVHRGIEGQRRQSCQEACSKEPQRETSCQKGKAELTRVLSWWWLIDAQLASAERDLGVAKVS